MKRGFIVFMVALSVVILLSPCAPQAASRCLSRSGITQALRALLTKGLIEAAAPPHSPNRRYRPVR